MRLADIYYLIWEKLRTHCLLCVQKRKGYGSFQTIINECSVNLLEQYTDNPSSDIDEHYKNYYISKLVNEHAFQAQFTFESIKEIVKGNNTGADRPFVIVDIGDSAGSHLKYQRKLLAGMIDDVRTISVNLDPAAVDRIRKGGGEAVLCRAEDYRPDGLDVDVYLSYEMVEHLHNPAIFFYKLAKSNNGRFMVVTVPYRKHSRVAVDNSMNHTNYDTITAENEHIFELSPKDWKRLLWHSGWKIRSEDIYYQYPRHSPLTPLYARIWDMNDFEGFYAMFLERDMSAANKYSDWED